MSKQNTAEKTSSSKQPVSEKPPTPSDEQSLDIIKVEIGILKELHSQIESNIQSMFNFYLSFVTAVIGGSVVVSQIIPASISTNNQMIIAGLLLFVGIVGVGYTGAISRRYAHLGRFAQALDEMRRCLLKKSEWQLPDVYSTFINMPTLAKENPFKQFFYWFWPVGTYHFVTNVLNSLALAVSIILFSNISSTGIANMAIPLGIVVFGIVFICQNIPARYTRYRLVTDLNVAVNIYGIKFQSLLNNKKG